MFDRRRRIYEQIATICLAILGIVAQFIIVLEYPARWFFTFSEDAKPSEIQLYNAFIFTGPLGTIAVLLLGSLILQPRRKLNGHDHNNIRADINRIYGYPAINALITRSIEMANYSYDMADFFKGDEQLGDNMMLLKHYEQRLRAKTLEIMIDFLLTDYRNSLERIYGHTGIRTALFLKIKNQQKIVRSHISEFRRGEQRSIVFDISGKPELLKGYCAISWIGNAPTCGTYRRPFPYIAKRSNSRWLRYKFFRKDKRFIKKNPNSESRSIVCLPIVGSELVSDAAPQPLNHTTSSKYQNEGVRAIICVDSTVRTDFLFDENELAHFNAVAYELKKKISEYIDLLPEQPTRATSS